MKQHNFCLSPKVAGLGLALFGLCAVLGLGSIGEAQAGRLALSQSFVPADRASAGGYAAILVGRASQDRKCPRSSNGCDKQPVCPNDANVCPKPQ